MAALRRGRSSGKRKRIGMGKLEGKVALVTGASRGIGRAIAKAYAREGARVFLCARSERGLEEAAKEIRELGGQVEWRRTDITRTGEVHQLVHEVRRRFGTIEILVNNASVLGPRTPIADYPLSAWNEVMRVNLTALFLVTKEVLKLMLSQREGSIINLSSGVARTGRARWGAYSVSKFGVEGFTQILAEEVKDSNIRVNAVNPGGTRTEMRAAAYPEENPMTLPTPDEITGVFVHLASTESRGVTGKSFDARDWIRRSVE
jgi:NAD(P)-dependent dehydrogenase (short-subunit alcohol dehydrogenase family)